ncbi:MAG: 2-hydroxyglutaryl-CoA dehydratase [Clostridiales bacterium]|nr:2-hydroxyglutaryl-CoA dehydratase [Clostridiales bacterium]
MIGGIDLGSRNVKIVLFKNNSLYKTYIYETISFYKKYGKKKSNQLQIDFSALGLPIMEKVVSTGYGRLTIEVEGAESIPEIKAHLYGALYQSGLRDFTLLDLGGQDSKIIKVRKGKMVDFLTNDKCAASSGRYLENMAKVLDITLEDLSNHWEDPVSLSSTCAVFGESELIGKIVEGHPIERLAAGVNYTIFKRIHPLLAKFPSDTIVFTGGVANNKALVRILEKETGSKVLIPPYPQFNGAIGCAFFGLEKMRN